MDEHLFRQAVYFVGSVLVVSVLSITALAALDKSIPDVLQNIGVGSLTGLVGLLVQKAR